MRKAKKAFIFFYLAGYLFLAGCASENSSSSQNAADTRTKDTLAYTMQSFKEISPYFAGSEEQLDSTKFTAYYPVFDSDINRLIQDAIYLDGEENMTQVAEGFLTAYNEYAEDQIAAESGPIHAWFRDISCQVLLNTGQFLTLQSSISEYTGGAHGIQVVVLSNYDVPEKRKLVLQDIVNDTTALKEIAERYFRKQENLSDTSSFGNDYFFDNDSFALADNYGLTKEGLLFYYNVYEIKPYADGPTSLFIPYSELKGIFTEKGSLLANTISTID